MKKLLLFALVIIALSNFSCGNKTINPEDIIDTTLTALQKDTTDATIYGLAGDGCTDSALIYIPFEGTNPITYDIIDAVKKKKIIGRLEVGDWIAVVVNPTDSTKADMVINLDQLKGEWVYKAMPKLVDNAKNVSSQIEKEVMDSMIEAAMIPNEQGFAILRNNVAEPVGKKISFNTDEMVLVEYPEIKPYTEWRIHNGLLLLSQAPHHVRYVKKDGSKKDSLVIKIDTIEFVFLIRDSLQLKGKSGVRDYYRKQD